LTTIACDKALSEICPNTICFLPSLVSLDTNIDFRQFQYAGAVGLPSVTTRGREYPGLMEVLEVVREEFNGKYQSQFKKPLIFAVNV
jgi:hypothetical protein